MTRNNLQHMTVEQLVDLFAQIGVEQDVACLEGNTAKYKRLFKAMANVSDELKNRSGDQRRALLGLYKHGNMQVQLMAAKKTLAVAPVEARLLLREISEAKWLVQSLDAGMCLWNLERGVFKPT